jgi:hypothetical protein
MPLSIEDIPHLERELTRIAMKRHELLAEGDNPADETLRRQLIKLADEESRLAGELAQIPVNGVPFRGIPGAGRRDLKGAATVVFAAQVIAAGWHPREKPSVDLKLASLLPDSKAITVPAGGTWSPLAPVVAPLGYDKRWLYPHLRTVDAGVDTSVNTFRQTGARTVTGTIERAIDATGTKADLAITLTAVNEPLKQEAITVSAVPNQLLESLPEVSQFLNDELL